jgi:hypothetical protein
MFLKRFFSFFYDVLILNTRPHVCVCVPQCSQVPDTALVSEGREGENPNHVVQNSFLLKLVILITPPTVLPLPATSYSAGLSEEIGLFKNYQEFRS